MSIQHRPHEARPLDHRLTREGETRLVVDGYDLPVLDLDVHRIRSGQGVLQSSKRSPVAQEIDHVAVIAEPYPLAAARNATDPTFTRTSRA